MSTLALVRERLRRLQVLLPDGEDLKTYAAKELDRRLASTSADTPMGIVPTSMLPAKQFLASARMAAELLDNAVALAAKPEGIVDLGVIEWIFRPSVPIRRNGVERIDAGPWIDLPGELLRRCSASVCRLDLAVPGLPPVHIGTGFVAGVASGGRLVLLTNAHVLAEAKILGWPQQERMVFGCSFERFSMDSDESVYALATEHEVHAEYDLAMLYLPRESFDQRDTIPEPLELSQVCPDVIAGLRIGVIGHPAFNSKFDPLPTFFGFGNEFGIKRISPGLIRSLTTRRWYKSTVEVFLHDATTLSGSSGSCILDLGCMKVVGLHFGGWPLGGRMVRCGENDVVGTLFEANGAIPLWVLHEDPLLRNLNFS